jgi:ElaB/YqjD/DUF883 family membrane-anchored ribosome-binding protein
MNVPYERSDGSPGRSAEGKSRDLRGEADAIREDLELTLHKLERRLSPGELLDRSLEYVQANGGDVMQKIGATVSNNPLPLLVTSAGLIWLFASSRSTGSRARFTSGSSSQRFGEFDSTASTEGSTGGSAEGSAEGMRGKAQAVKQRVKQTVGTAQSRAANALHSTRDHAREYGDTLHNFVTEQPLACGAIAIAVGAVIGAAFPASAYERNLVASARTAAGNAVEAMNEGESESGNARGGAAGTSQSASTSQASARSHH